MTAYGYLLEIAGLPWAVASSANAPVQFGQTVLPYLSEAPVSAPLRCDPLEGTSESGGGTVWARNVGAALTTYFFQMRATSPITRLTEDLAYDELDADVEDSTEFAGSGYLYIGKETIYYTAHAANTFTIDAAGRGQFGSEAVDHERTEASEGSLYPQVYGFPPSLSGRRCWLWRYEIEAPTSKKQMFGGEIDDCRWHPDGQIEFILRSMQSKLMDASACDMPFASGTVVYSATGANPTSTGRVMVRLDNPDVPFPSPHTHRKYAYFLYTGEEDKKEIIGYEKEQHPAFQYAAAACIAGDWLNLAGASLNDRWQVGDVVEIETAPAQRRTVVEVDAGAIRLRLSEAFDSPPVGGELVKCISKQYLYQMEYGGADIPLLYCGWAPWRDGAKMQELRYVDGSRPDGSGGFIAGEDLDILLQILTSRYGDEGNGNYDVLSPGWGLGVSEDLIDWDAFDELRALGRGGPRHYLLTEPLPLRDLLKWYSWANSCYFFVNRAGKFSCAAISTLYPGESPDLELTVSQIGRDDLVSMEAQESRVRNSWVWNLARPATDRKNGAPSVTIRPREVDSVDLYDARELPAYDDPGADEDVTLQAVSAASSMFARYGRICPRHKLSVPLYLGYDLEPGKKVEVTWPHVPDCAGGAGIDEQMCEVISVVPADARNALEIECEPIWNDRAGLVAPAMVVDAWDPVTLSFTALARSTSLLSQAGAEDSDHFQIDDPVRVWDVSTLGSGAEVSADTTIASVDWGTRRVQLTTSPAWIASGDLVVPKPFVAAEWAGRDTSTQTPPVTAWDETFVALADETETPPQIDTQLGYRFGG